MDGVDVNDEDADGNTSELRSHIGDVLHGRPTIVNYGGSQQHPDSVVYFGSNEGFIHAIETGNGNEVFAFMPWDLLPNLRRQYDNNTSDDKPYGMDGDLTIWTEDVDHDHQISSAAGDHVYLYAGMRRGGNSYHALNTTDKDAPVYLWDIIVDNGEFAELGQTWSSPILGNVRLGDQIKKVLVFAEDTTHSRIPSTTAQLTQSVKAFLLSTLKQKNCCGKPPPIIAPICSCQPCSTACHPRRLCST